MKSNKSKSTMPAKGMNKNQGLPKLASVKISMSMPKGAKTVSNPNMKQPQGMPGVPKMPKATTPVNKASMATSKKPTDAKKIMPDDLASMGFLPKGRKIPANQKMGYRGMTK